VGDVGRAQDARSTADTLVLGLDSKFSRHGSPLKEETLISFARVRGTATAIAALLLALVLPSAASAKEEGPKVTAMTRNVFLGADLGPVLTAPNIPAAIDGAGTIWNEFQSTNFPERAVPLAQEIKAAKPDLVGLQEVALWQKQVPSDGGAPPLALPGLPARPATLVEQDFLALLLQELAAIDAHYEVIEIQTEFTGELPADVDQNDNTGFPFGADLDARLTMRDVILARGESKVTLGDTDGANFQNKFVPRIAGIIPLPVDRGWLSVEGTVMESETDSAIQFRFVNTHLEAFGADEIREAQAKELFDEGGPLDTEEQVILVGDLNSGLEDPHNIHGTDQLAFRALTLEPPDGFGMRDNGAIQSCCYSDLFDPTQVFDHTVDHVLTKPGLRTKEAFITGDDVSERTPSGLWPSDHGGVVSRLVLKKG
jgi:endonuclease/exonuclease/phosphatase family metal-dependent hydrolase